MTPEYQRYFFREVLSMAHALDAATVKFYKNKIFVVPRMRKKVFRKRNGEDVMVWVGDKKAQKTAEESAPYVALGLINSPWSFESADAVREYAFVKLEDGSERPVGKDEELPDDHYYKSVPYNAERHPYKPEWTNQHAWVWKIDKKAERYIKTGDVTYLDLDYHFPPRLSAAGTWPFDTHAFSENKWRYLGEPRKWVSVRRRDLFGKYYLEVKEFARSHPDWQLHCFNFLHLHDALQKCGNWKISVATYTQCSNSEGLYCGRADSSRSWLLFCGKAATLKWFICRQNSEPIRRDRYRIEDISPVSNEYFRFGLDRNCRLRD